MPTHALIEKVQKQFKPYRCDQHAHAQPRKRYRPGRDDLLDRRLNKLIAQQQYQHRHDHAGQIFVSRMAERMLLVRRAARQLEADERNHRRTRGGQVVKRISLKRDRRAQHARDELACKQNQIYENAHDARRVSAALARPGIVRTVPAGHNFFAQRIQHVIILKLKFLLWPRGHSFYYILYAGEMSTTIHLKI